MRRVSAATILRILTPVGIVATGVGVFLLFGQKPPPPPPPAVDDPAVLVETAPAEAFDGSFALQVDGVALPVRRINLAAEVQGRIIGKSPQARGGRRVDAGTPLFEIDPTDYLLQVEQLQAQLRQATEQLAAVDVDIANTQSLVELAEEDQQLARRSLDRARDLNGRNAVSDTELDEARRQELSSRNALLSLQNQLRTLQQQRRTQQAARDLVAVQLKQAQADLARTRIVSPIAGTVVEDQVEVDDHVRPGDVLIELSDNSQMEIRCSLTVDQLFWIWLADTGGKSSPDGSTGAAAEEKFLPPAGSGPVSSGGGVSGDARLELPRLPVTVLYRLGGRQIEWDGILSRYEGSGLDAQTRTVPCRILVSDPTQGRIREQSGSGRNSGMPPIRIFSGMYVELRIPITVPVPLVKVPLAAVRPGSSAKAARQVWVRRDRELRIRTVEVARLEAGFALIHAASGGVQPGDRVVVSPLASVRDGMPVREASDDPFSPAAGTAVPVRDTATGGTPVPEQQGKGG